jgi:hypothetical protein
MPPSDEQGEIRSAALGAAPEKTLREHRDKVAQRPPNARLVREIAECSFVRVQ